MSSRRLILTPLTILLGLASLPAQTWTPEFPSHTTQFLARKFLVYDSARMLVTGFGELGGKFSATTSWDGDDWTEDLASGLAGEHAPARTGGAIVYDSHDNKIYLTGGNVGATLLDDLWEFDCASKTWTSLQGTPGGRINTAMAYDAERGQVVLFGGDDSINSLDDTCLLTTNRFQNPHPATVPPARSGHTMVYDSARKVVVMFGGVDQLGNAYDDTWEWNGADWTQVMTATKPVGRSGHTMTYDSDHEVVVVHGGVDAAFSNLVDTWEYDGVDWEQTSSSGPGLSGVAAFDAARGETVWLEIDTGNTWTYTGPPVGSYAPFGQGCVGSAGVPVLGAAGGGVPLVNSSFDIEITNLPAGSAGAFLAIGFSDEEFGALDLPLDVTVMGLWGCTLHTDVAVVFPMVVVGQTATITMSIPNWPLRLGGLTFFTQGAVHDPAVANPLKFILTNGARGRVGL